MFGYFTIEAAFFQDPPASPASAIGSTIGSTVNPGAGHPQMVQFLLDLSADATSFAEDGKTPLEVEKNSTGMDVFITLHTLEIFGHMSKRFWYTWQKWLKVQKL